MIEPTDLALSTPGVYSLTLRLSTAKAQQVRSSLAEFDTSVAIQSDDDGSDVLTFRMFDASLLPSYRGEAGPQPPPVFDNQNRLLKAPVTLAPGSVVRVSYLPRMFAPFESAAYHGFEPAPGIYFVAVQVLKRAG